MQGGLRDERGTGGQLQPVDRHLRAAPEALCMCGTAQVVLPSKEMFKREKGAGHPAPVGFNSSSLALNLQPRSCPPSQSTARDLLRTERSMPEREKCARARTHLARLTLHEASTGTRTPAKS